MTCTYFTIWVKGGGISVHSEGLFEHKTPKLTATGIWHVSFKSVSSGPQTFNFRQTNSLNQVSPRAQTVAL